MVRKWLRGCRLAFLTTVAVGTATGLVFAWVWTDGGLFLVLIVIAGPFVAVWLFWLAISDSGRGKTATEPTETSEWEVMLRPHFPRDEQPEILPRRQKEGDEA
jgi:hypothetical protein